MLNSEKLTLQINKKNVKNLISLIKLLETRNIPLVDVIFDSKNPPDFFKIRSVLYTLINRFEEKTSMIFFNLPYCILPDAEEHIINISSNHKTKSPQCKECKFNRFCAGFPEDFSNNPEPVKDLPKEISIEITSKCNLNCFFCFSPKHDYEFIDSEVVFSVINQAYKMGIRRIRFTGGEPFMDSNLYNYVKYAKSLKMEVWINSNGTFTDNKHYTDIIKHTDSVLIPLHHSTPKGEAKITGNPYSFKNKLKTVLKIKRINPRIFLRAGTVINEKNRDSLFDIFLLIKKKLGLVHENYRLIHAEAEKKSLCSFFNHSLKFYEKFGTRSVITNAFPFCFLGEGFTARVFSLGGFMDDGRDRMVISVNGDVKPVYYSDDVAGTWKNINAAWNSTLMKKLRNLEYLPERCKVCEIYPVCKGGSRTMAKKVFGSYYAEDPLVVE